MAMPLQCGRGRLESLWRAGSLIPLLVGVSLSTMAFGAPAQISATSPMRQSPHPALPQSIEVPPDVPPLSPAANAKRQRDLMKANYEKLKQEADELANLAKSLQDELSSSSPDVLSLKVVQNAEKIEKLAKKIRGSAVENTN